METIKQKLINLSHTRTLAKITVLNSKGEQVSLIGRIYFSSGENHTFRIFKHKSINITFKSENVVRLSKMTKVWETQSINKILRYKDITL